MIFHFINEYLIGTATLPLVVCIVLALEDMETDMMMIGMKAVLETEMMTGMAMGEKEILEMMTDMVVMENHMAVRGTGIVEIMRRGMAEMDTRTMSTEEEVKALMITSMGQEVEVLIEKGVRQMRMTANTLPGLLNYHIAKVK